MAKLTKSFCFNRLDTSTSFTEGNAALLAHSDLKRLVTTRTNCPLKFTT
jgi:hypothetical protein